MPETKTRSVASDVSHFLEGLPKQRPLLSSPVQDAEALHVWRLRSEFAKRLLASPQFTEAVQLANEKVMQDIFNCDEDERLVALRERLRGITYVVDELMIFVDRYEEIIQIQNQHERREYGHDSYEEQFPESREHVVI